MQLSILPVRGQHNQPPRHLTENKGTETHRWKHIQRSVGADCQVDATRTLNRRCEVLRVAVFVGGECGTSRGVPIVPLVHGESRLAFHPSNHFRGDRE